MKLQIAFKILVLIMIISIGAGEIFAMDPDDVISLKKAGVGDAVIEALVREKSLETAAFTADEIVKMKKAGVGESALVKMIEEKSFVRGEKEVTYGKDVRPATRATVNDIMELKNAGISDEVINTIVKNQAVDPNSEEQRRAMEILNNMGFIIDIR